MEQVLLTLVLHQEQEALPAAVQQDLHHIVVEVQLLHVVVILTEAVVLPHLLMELLVPLLPHGVIHRLLPVVVHVAVILPVVAVVLPDLLVVAAPPVVVADRKSDV